MILVALQAGRSVGESAPRKTPIHAKDKGLKESGRKFDRGVAECVVALG